MYGTELQQRCNMLPAQPIPGETQNEYALPLNLANELTASSGGPSNREG